MGSFNSGLTCLSSLSMLEVDGHGWLKLRIRQAYLSLALIRVALNGTALAYISKAFILEVGLLRV